MSILYLILILAIVVGMTWWLGSWNIMINLINFYISALVASSFFEPLADKLEGFDDTFTYLVDFVAIWMLFVVCFAALRLVTDFLTQYQLRMNIWLEYALRTILAFWLGAGFVCFTFFTFHLAPFPPGKPVVNKTKKLYGIGPDQQWMAFIQSRSRGALSQSKEGLFLSEYDLFVHPDDKELGVRVFDPFAEFATRYISRRQNLSKSSTLRVLK